MDTKWIKIESNKTNDVTLLQSAAEIIRSGGLVAFPTETVYGLGANALDEEASKRIYQAKGRPSDNPLITHIADLKDLNSLVSEIPEAAKLLMDAFWPGPLTLIFKKSSLVPYSTTGGLDTVAIRMPNHPIALELIRISKVPIAAPSANRSGKPSPTLASHVAQDMKGRIDMIIDGGEVGIGLESTIVDVSESIPAILRPGAITMAMLAEVLGSITVDSANRKPLNQSEQPKAPGMKYRHYAPDSELTLVSGELNKVVDKINYFVSKKEASGCRVGIICSDETINGYKIGIPKSMGPRKDQSTIAHNLYRILREFDDLQVDCIFSETFPSDELGDAIMNRLTKAAGYHMIEL